MRINWFEFPHRVRVRRKLIKSPLGMYSRTIITCGNTAKLAYHTLWKFDTQNFYRLSHNDHTIQLDNVGVSKLAVDGCLLQKFDSVFFCHILSECLDGHIVSVTTWSPSAPFHHPKLTRPQLCTAPREREKEGREDGEEKRGKKEQKKEGERKER